MSEARLRWECEWAGCGQVWQGQEDRKERDGQHLGCLLHKRRRGGYPKTMSGMMRFNGLLFDHRYMERGLSLLRMYVVLDLGPLFFTATEF